MSGQYSADRLQQLLELLVNGTISDAEHHELQSLLRDNPDAQAAYFEAVDLHVGLHKLTTEKPVAEKFPSDSLEPLQAAAVGSQAERAITQHFQAWTPGSDRLRSVVTIVTALAVVVLLITVLPTIIEDDSNGSQQAGGLESDSQLEQDIVTDDHDERRAVAEEVILAQSAGAELFGEFLPPVGDALAFDHEYALVAGVIELRFPDGAEVILEAPSVIEITSRERLVVRAGNCSVHAPPGAEGFQVETPQTEITDLGTRFSVSVSEVGETDVQVVEGLAEVLATSDESAKPIRLSEREARRFNGETGTGPQSLEFDADGYRNTLPDRVVSYETSTTDDGFAWELQSVTVQRDGLIQTFPVGDLTGVKVIHFRAGGNNANVAVPTGYEGDRLVGLESDALLHTGVLNPGGSTEPLRHDPVLGEVVDGESTPGMAIQFREGVVNRPGPDVVFFELQTLVNPPEGDAFHVSPLKFDGSLLRSAKTTRSERQTTERRLHSLTIRRYDIAMTSREARLLPEFDLFFFQDSATSLDSLVSGSVDRRPQTLRFRALAVGIDLSDLGYNNGATVDGLFFQDILDDGDVVDPVFVAGLP